MLSEKNIQWHLNYDYNLSKSEIKPLFNNNIVYKFVASWFIFALVPRMYSKHICFSFQITETCKSSGNYIPSRHFWCNCYLQTLFLLFKTVHSNETKELFVSWSVANSFLFTTIITIGDVTFCSSCKTVCLPLHNCLTSLDHETSSFTKVTMNYIFLMVATLMLGSLHGGK